MAVSSGGEVGAEEGPASNPDCWYCSGIDAAACPMCSEAKPSEDTRPAVKPEPTTSDATGGKVFPARRFEPPMVQKTVESVNLKLLVEAEDFYARGLPQEALELTNRALRNLEQHFDACEGRGITAMEARPMLKRGEREMFCLGWACSARCCLYGKAYENCVEEIKKFSSVYDGLTDCDQFDASKLAKLERRLLNELPPGVSFVRDMSILQAALEIQLSCKQKVSNGWAPKTVIDHAEKALVGLRPLDAEAFRGLGALRAELLATKSQAELELERWDEAEEDAKEALELDPSNTAAAYLLECAQNEDW